VSRDIKILIVDDDRDICEYMELLLSQNGYDVRTLTESEKALDLIREVGFHVVVLDLMMPGISGMELLADIREYDSDLAIIIFTGHATVDTAVASMKHQVSDYIKKPFDIDEFNSRLEAVLRDKGLLVSSEERLLLTIGQNIRRCRKEQDLTLKQMSRRTGLSVSLLSQIERAESSASVSSLHKLAQALDCRLTDLFGDF
jgi:two-component system OmpR family response regulator